MEQVRFNEDTRVKIPATIQFMRLGYEYLSLENSVIDFETKIFVEQFKKDLSRINNVEYSDNDIHEILMDIDNICKNNDLGKAFYNWIINPLDKPKLIDFNDINNNTFYVVTELPYTVDKNTEKGSFRPDVNILINGIPLAFLEVKPPNNEGGIQAEFDRMVNKRLENTKYKKFFNKLQLVTFSNNMEYENEDSDDASEIKAGSFYSTPNGKHTGFSFFREDEKDYHNNYNYLEVTDDQIKEVLIDNNYSVNELDTVEFQTNLDKNSPCNSFITSLFDKERFMFILYYGIMFVDEKVKQKHIMRYPQFFASRATLDRLENGGKRGIIWHTQGSGKTGLFAFSVRILKDYYAKKGINTRFYYVVDRLPLLRQASTEFKNRGLKATNVDGKIDFIKELNKVIPTDLTSDSLGEVCVVNIQKFSDNIPEAGNAYNSNIQRIFYVDEAHRSYSLSGEFFKNLITCDRDGVFIALTGTPLLTKKERSNLKFGDYIHKYFYDKSIADGYTLRIKKENVDTVAKAEIKKNLDIKETDLNDKSVYESDDFVSALSKWIQNDFNNFRLINEDDSIGGMIVCRTNAQAKKVHKWFKENSSLKTGVVITDTNNPEQAELNKNYQINFRETNSPDILVVNMMLTTGYDVRRLKRMYLLREPHAQNLLQTVSRVNRPYTSPTGKVYKYGYITDFVDITAEYDRTIDAYLKELESDLNEDDDNMSLQGLIVSVEDVNKKYQKYNRELLNFGSYDNKEIFSQRLSIFNKETLLKIKRLLNGIKSCHTEFRLSNETEYIKQIDIKLIKALINLVQKRIDFINLNDKPVDTLNILSNKEIVDIIYYFIKDKMIKTLDLGKLEESKEYNDLKETIKNIQDEIQRNKNKKDIQMIKLDMKIKEIFSKLEVNELDLAELDDINKELLEALEQAKQINENNDRLSAIYGGNFSFVATYQDILSKYKVDQSIVEKLLLIIYDEIKDKMDMDTVNIQGCQNFINGVKTAITANVFKAKIYKDIKIFYDETLRVLFKNIQIY